MKIVRSIVHVAALSLMLIGLLSISQMFHDDMLHGTISYDQYRHFVTSAVVVSLWAFLALASGFSRLELLAAPVVTQMVITAWISTWAADSWGTYIHSRLLGYSWHVGRIVVMPYAVTVLLVIAVQKVWRERRQAFAVVGLSLCLLGLFLTWRYWRWPSEPIWSVGFHAEYSPECQMLRSRGIPFRIDPRNNWVYVPKGAVSHDLLETLTKMARPMTDSTTNKATAEAPKELQRQ